MATISKVLLTCILLLLLLLTTPIRGRYILILSHTTLCLSTFTTSVNHLCGFFLLFLHYPLSSSFTCPDRLSLSSLTLPLNFWTWADIVTFTHNANLYIFNSATLSFTCCMFVSATTSKTIHRSRSHFSLVNLPFHSILVTHHLWHLWFIIKVIWLVITRLLQSELLTEWSSRLWFVSF